MIRCRKCVIPDTRPDTPFLDGICSACLSYPRRKEVDWGARERMFRDLMAAHKDPDLAFDCVVASSGGKDSHWQVLKLIDMGYRPLAVTASTCMLTPTGRANIDNLARYAETIEVTTNRTVRAKLNRIGLELVGDISWPEHATIFNVPWWIAAGMGISLVFYGENPQEAYGGPKGTEDAQRMTRRWVTEFGGFLGLRAQDLVGTRAGDRTLTQADMDPYIPMTIEQADAAMVQAHFLGAYFEWDSNRNAAVAREHGFRADKPTDANWWDHENQDNAMTGLHDHLMYRKYGYGRGAAQISVDVRAGLVSREEAIEFVRLHDGAFPWEYAGVPLAQILQRLELTEGGLMDICNNFTNGELFARVVESRPILKEFA